MVHTVKLFICFLLMMSSPVCAAYSPLKVGNGSQAVTDVKNIVVNGAQLINNGSGNVKLIVQSSGGGGGSGTVTRVKNGDTLTTITNQTTTPSIVVNSSLIYSGTIANGDIAQYGTQVGWSAERNGGTMRSIQPSGDNGITFNVSSLSGNGGGLRATLNTALFQTANGNLTTWSNKSVPSGVVVGTTDTQTLTNKTLTSPTLTTPVLGTPSSGTLTSCTGLPISTGVSGLGTGVATALATPSSANWATAFTDETGTSKIVFNGSPAITSPTITSATLNRVTTFNGNTMSIPALTQGDILFSKISSSITRLAKGADHSALKVNGNRLAWEPVSGGGSSPWSTSGTSVVLGTPSNNVSIGKTDLNGKLMINGDIAFKPIAAPSMGMMSLSRLYVNSTTNNLTFLKAGMSPVSYDLMNPPGIKGPGTVTSDRIVLFNGTTGNAIKQAPVAIDMMGGVTGVGSMAISGGMSNPLVVSTNALVVDTSGNVGIGTASPGYKLDVTGASEFTDQINIANNKYLSWNNGMGYVNIMGLNSSNDLIIKNNTDMMGSNGDILFQPMTSGGESFRLAADGNVGVYDRSPDFKLDVNGSFFAKSLALNGTALSLSQGAVLYSKVAGSAATLAKGTNHYALKVNGNALAWEPVSGGTSAGGSSGQIQINNSGSFAGNGSLFWDFTNKRLGIGTGTPAQAKARIVTQSAAEQGLVLQAAASQTGNLTEWRNSAGTLLSTINNGGRLGIGIAPIGAHQFDVHKLNPGNGNVFFAVGDLLTAGKPLVYFQSSLTGTSAITERRDLDFFIGPWTNQLAFKVTGTTGAIVINGNSAAAIPLTIEGAAAQSGNATQWLNSAGTVLSFIDNGGRLNIGDNNRKAGFVLDVNGAATATTLTTTGKVVAGTNVNGTTANFTKVISTGRVNGTGMVASNGMSMLSLTNYGNGGTARTLDPKKGNFIYLQLNGSTCAIKIAKPNGPTRAVIALRQFSATRLATWNADIAWPAATAPTLSTTSGYVDFVTCVHMGSTILSNKWNCQITNDLR
jgi:hypothetical protein